MSHNHQRILSVRLAWAMVFFIAFFVAVDFGRASDDDQGLNTVSGKVVEIDSLKSLITVSYPNPVSGGVEEIDIVVPEGTKIMNGSEPITFLDIEQFDPVSVTYSGDSVGGFKAREILDLNRGNQ